MKFQYILVASLIGLTACTQLQNTSDKPLKQSVVVDPQLWPKASSPIARTAQQEERIADILSRMTLEEKVGQVIQADIASVTPQQVRDYHLGSILNGGNSNPNNDLRAPASAWLALADEFWLASTDTSDGGVGIPALWGIDAVHGNNNVVGATLFPHNIGLGAANDVELIHRIGEITAKEILAVGIDWTFAPTIAVARDDRWGRTYESYSEHPDIVRRYASAMVEGIQGKVNSTEFLNEHHLLANVKHFLGDGGTINGTDQGNNVSSQTQLRDIHGAGYPAAIQSGALVVMASFNAWHGQKLHGHKALLNDVLVERMGFDGFVVGDWNGHGQVKGCNKYSCAQAFNAGLDMFMAPDSWKQLYSNTLKQVKSGVISMQRLDQAVTRILRVKLRAGLFDAGLPSERLYAGKFDLLGAPEHRQVAREAVRKSLVLLKNEAQLLPLNPKSKVLVLGSAADNIAQQSGGWSLTWQGNGLTNADFPNGLSIYKGIRQAVEQAGGEVALSLDGEYSQKPDVAIVVFGEQPYAEFQGDRAHLDFESQQGLLLLRKMQGRGIPVVAVFLSGRPMWVNPEINASDAFVAAWLPGTEGAGVADVLFTDENGQVQFDFTGKLSFSWPNSPSDTELNWQDKNYDPLFAYGYGLSVTQKHSLGELNESLGIDRQNNQYMYAGDPVPPWQLQVSTSAPTSNASQLIELVAVDDQAQEDTVLATWLSQATLSISGPTTDITPQLKEGMSLVMRVKVVESTAQSVSLTMQCEQECAATLDLTEAINQSKVGQWQDLEIKLQCFSVPDRDLTAVNSIFNLSSTDGLVLQLKEIGLKKTTQQGIKCN